MKSVQIRSYFWSVFSCIRTEYGEVQSEYRKIRTSNNSVFGHFSHSVILRKFLWICIITFVMTVLWSYVITVSFAYYFFPFYYFWNNQISRCVDFSLYSNPFIFRNLFVYPCVISPSEDVEVNTGPRTKASNTFSVCHWNLSSISAHNCS